ncbi:MAG: hypothetical protein K6C36_08195 [Clostridia bacterium]|nr:hypothetical protein [Clostridia bacterium]
MIRVSGLSLPLGADGNDLRSACAKKLGVREEEFLSFELLRSGYDARDKGDVRLTVSCLVALDCDERAFCERFPENEVAYSRRYEYAPPELKRTSAERPVVVGFGPAGFFCALMLARAGLKPLVLERGGSVDERKNSVERFVSGRVLDEESNIQFGEGGAGTFSDGKLTTGIKDPRCRFVLEELAAHGAPSDILTNAHPHIGTDRLPDTVRGIRDEIISLGGEVKFNCRFTDLVTASGGIYAVEYVENSVPGAPVRYFQTDTVVLACGHSARDTVRSLYEAGVRAERKAFSVGLRIEHLQSMINRAQYGARFADSPLLPPAEYKLANHPPHGRGAYTFCMCPGGTVVAAASEAGGVVTNGMSRFARDGENANAAILVGFEPDRFDTPDVFAGVELQRELESKAFALGGNSYAAPATTVGDFLKRRASKRFGAVRPTYTAGVCPSDVRQCLPASVCDEIETAILRWDRVLSGFASPDAVLTAPESRSTSPVRLVRDPFGRSNISGLYPCGEGAGYAGGIVSAAVDGIKTAESIISAADWDD